MAISNKFTTMVLLLSVLTASGRAQWYSNKVSGKSDTRFLAGLNAGINTLNQANYPGYTDFYNFGLDVLILPDYSRSSEKGMFEKKRDAWVKNIYYRVSIDYFPLIVPDGTYGTVHDIYGYSISAIYGFLNRKKINAFAGFALGSYNDRITVTTPNVNSTSSFSNIGFNISLGMGFEPIPLVRIVPEIRQHFISLGSATAGNMTAQVALYVDIKRITGSGKRKIKK